MFNPLRSGVSRGPFAPMTKAKGEGDTVRGP
jgi:hypothetical protein